MRTISERIQKIRKGIPDSLKGIYDRALRGKSKAVAIRAKCLDCNAWDRKEAKLCTAVECPLFRHNPYTQKGKESQNDPKTGTDSEVKAQTHATAGVDGNQSA